MSFYEGDGPEADYDGLTTAQVEALNRAFDLLKEHFDSAIIAFSTETSTGMETLFDCNYSGGLTNGIGLAERTKDRLMRIARGDIQPTEGD